MTGGTVLIGGPFVFPCARGSTWHAQRLKVQQPTPFYGPKFPKSLSAFNYLRAAGQEEAI